MKPQSWNVQRLLVTAILTAMFLIHRQICEKFGKLQNET